MLFKFKYSCIILAMSNIQGLQPLGLGWMLLPSHLLNCVDGGKHKSVKLPNPEDF